MSNDVRIGVSADTSSTTSGLGGVEQSARKVAQGVKEISAASAKAETDLKRLAAIAKTLSSEMGRAIDPKQAEAFLKNFDSIRNNRHISGGSKLRQFDSFEDFHARSNSLFIDQREAERYKRRVYNLAGQGTGAAFMQSVHPGQQHTPYRQPGAGTQQGGQYGAVVNQGMSGMKGLVGAGLALAGITSVMAMAGRAVDLARTEATANDQLLRTVGDLDKTFDDLRSRVRASGEGLGVLYAESAALSKHYAKIANGDGGDIGGNLRTGYGLARGYGLELGEGVSFMAQSRHFGQIGADDQNGRKFALMIAESIEKGGNTAKAGEVLAAVSNFSSQVAKLALTAPNAAGFAGALAGLTSTHTPGLDPTNAASMLMTADNAIRNGGGMGEAGLNFTYGALSRVMPGLDPITAKAVMEQGAFGSGVSSSVSEYARRNNIAMPNFSGQDNLSLVMGEMDRQYGNSMTKLDATKNYFGLGSLSQAAALSNLDRKQLGGLQGLLGDDVSSLSASGIQNVARIGAAGDDELRQIAGRLMQREDLTDTERKGIKGALADDDMKALRETMAKAVAVREQEKNVGTETRDAVVGLNNTLTTVGGAILPVMTGIQEAVVAMARAIAPDSAYSKQMMLQEGAGEYQARKADLLAKHEEQLQTQAEAGARKNVRPEIRAQYEADLRAQQAAELQAFERENYKFEDYIKSKKGAGSVVPGGAGSGPIDLGPMTPSDAANVPLSLINAMIQQESGGRHFGADGKLLTNGKSGARGLAQIMPATGMDPGYGVRPLQNDSEEEHLRFASDYLAAMLKKYDGDTGKALAAYNAGPGVVDSAVKKHGADWLSGMPSETQAYVPSVMGMADGFTGNMPGGAGSGSQPIKVEVSVNGTLSDRNQNVIGELEQGVASVSIPMAAGAR